MRRRRRNPVDQLELRGRGSDVVSIDFGNTLLAVIYNYNYGHNLVLYRYNLPFSHHRRIRNIRLNSSNKIREIAQQ